MPTLPSRAAPAALALAVALTGLAPAPAGAHDREQRRAERAHARLDALLKDPPQGPDRFYSVGKELLSSGDYGDAAVAFEEAAKRSQKPGNSHYNRACALALGGWTDAAFASLRAALDAGYDDPDHMAEDEDLERLHGDPRFAALLADAELLEMPPVNPGHHGGGWFGSWGRGHDRGAVRESREAAERLRAYLARHPGSGRAAYGLGIAQLNLREYEASARAFEAALSLGYRPAATLYNLACVEARRGRPEPALAYLDRAIEAGFHEPWQLRTDDDLDALRGDARFRAAVAKAKALAKADDHGRHGGLNWTWGSGFTWDDDEDDEDVEED
ncbi:MAG: tetratricopeptide repeat protein [Anaeromyxobacteraceae bacterium]